MCGGALGFSGLVLKAGFRGTVLEHRDPSRSLVGVFRANKQLLAIGLGRLAYGPYPPTPPTVPPPFPRPPPPPLPLAPSPQPPTFPQFRWTFTDIRNCLCQCLILRTRLHPCGFRSYRKPKVKAYISKLARSVCCRQELAPSTSPVSRRGLDVGP